MIEELKTTISSYVNNRIQEVYALQANLQAETPKNKENGDIAIPAFPLCKTLHKRPDECASIVQKFLNELPYFEKIEVVNGFVNASYSREALSKIILASLGREIKNDHPLTYCIDYSSPN